MSIIMPHTAGGDFRGFKLENNSPTGTYPAIVAGVKDYFDVDVQKFGEPDVTEKKDTTFICFAYKAEGEVHLVSTFEMTQSASPKSKLFNLLKDIKGEPPVFNGEYNYESEVGRPLQITVAKKVSRMGKEYTYPTGFAPLLEDLWDKAPKLEDVQIPNEDNGQSPDEGEDPFQIKDSEAA